jgi:hypothetical protein
VKIRSRMTAAFFGLLTSTAKYWSASVVTIIKSLSTGVDLELCVATGDVYDSGIDAVGDLDTNDQLQQGDE